MPDAFCKKCHRKLVLTQMRPGCPYCGGELQMSAEDAQSLADAHAAEEAARPIARLRVTCPVCERNLILKSVRPGDEKNCMYCSSLFTIQNAEGTVLAGPDEGQFADDLPEGVETLFDEAAQAVGLGFGDSSPILYKIPRKALLWRLLHGHADMDEVNINVGLLQLVENSAPYRNNPESWTCPLPPSLTAGMITSLACQSLPGTISNDGEFDRIVRIVTDYHTCTTLAQNDDMGTYIAKTAFKGFVRSSLGVHIPMDGDNLEVQRYKVNHYLRIDLNTQPDGCSLDFSHEYATGEAKPLEDKQKELIPKILRSLSQNAGRFIALRAIYGEWFNANTLTCLHASCLHGWLQRLSDGFDIHPQELSQFCLAALPDRL